MRLHRGGRFRAWIGARFGGDAEVGNRIWRRILHGLGALVLLYYLLPHDVLVIAPNWVIPPLALAALFALEALRLGGVLEIPTIRPYEEHRIASYAYFGLALVIAVLLFPLPIAAAVALGTAVVDPICGEMRTASSRRWSYPGIPFAVYALLAWAALVGVGEWPPGIALLLALFAAALAIVAESPRTRWVDDDLAMTLVPGVALWIAAYLIGGLH